MRAVEPKQTHNPPRSGTMELHTKHRTTCNNQTKGNYDLNLYDFVDIYLLFKLINVTKLGIYNTGKNCLYKASNNASIALFARKLRHYFFYPFTFM